MERSDNSEDEFFTSGLSRTLQALRQVLLGFKAAKVELAAENAALKEQRASWELEKKMLLDEKEYFVSNLLMARMYIKSVKESLEFHKTETKKETMAWQQQHHQLNEIEVNKDWESRRPVTQKEVAAELESLQQDSERMRSKIIQVKEEAITSVRKEMMALEEEHLAKQRAKEEEICQRETEWQTKHKVLEGQLECQLATKEILKKSHQKQSSEVEEKWLNKEGEWLIKEGEMKEEMQLLNQQNAHLQELATKTDKEKTKMKKEEEKRIRNERKEREKREEKERKDRVKREKKENEERKQREKTDRKEGRETSFILSNLFCLSSLRVPSPMPASSTPTEMS
ncbi:hypothetical protein PBY51_002884 [Eleginops maclovinus]|uniref:Uncharacterized protein n=1 Tax=Eleginops maclovinus TaxID=56733 RepID=A0AAN7XEJ6_ELEMC|nr:hypothetical protein PBY51_002884 [Eleginops maclovinus]